MGTNCDLIVHSCVFNIQVNGLTFSHCSVLLELLPLFIALPQQVDVWMEIR